jgi:hypothetical protein
MWCIGGAVKSAIDGSPIRDVDLFFDSEEVYAEFVRRMTEREHIDIQILRYDGSLRGERPHITVMSYEHGWVYDVCNWEYGSLAHHIKNNAFLHMCGACSMEGNLLMHEATWTAIKKKRVVPMHSLKFKTEQASRLMKLIDDGWTISTKSLDFFRAKLGYPYHDLNVRTV